MSNPNNKPDRLFALARRASAPGHPTAEKAPLGFATCVAARQATAGSEGVPGDFLERCCWWGAGISVAVCLLPFGLRPTPAEPQGFDWLLQVPPASQTLFEL